MQYMVGLCRQSNALFTPAQLVPQDPQVLFCTIAFCLVSVEPDCCIELSCPRYRTLRQPVKLHDVPLGAFLQLVKAPVNGGPTLPISAAPRNAMLSMNF